MLYKGVISGANKFSFGAELGISAMGNEGTAVAGSVATTVGVGACTVSIC